MKKTAAIILAILSLCCSLAVLSGLPSNPKDRFISSGRPLVRETPALPEGFVSINTAGQEDLLLLPGIGESLAHAILDERNLHCDFHYPEDLIAVKGIGNAKLAQIQSYLDMSEGE